MIEPGPGENQLRAYPKAEPGLAPDAIQAQLEKILSGNVFSQSARLSRFLRFIVEQTIHGKGNQVKEYLLGVEVFDRNETYDPRIDPVVRVEARRLRYKLKEYYETEGRDDAIEIDLPKGGYAPVFIGKIPAPDTRPKVGRGPFRLFVGRQTTLVVALFLLVGLAAYYWTARKRDGVRFPSIAVLPLENLSADPDQEYFSDGMTDALITDLAKIRSLRVISRTSVTPYKKIRRSLPEVAQKLGVDYVVEGTVQRAQERVRITAQLIAASAERHLWAETYEGDVSNILDLQSRISQAIAGQIRIQLAPQEQARSGRAVDRDALEAYLKGRYYLNRASPLTVRKSIEYFNQAIEKSPSYALAYAGLADSYCWLAYVEILPRSDCYKKAKAAAKRALELDDTLGEAYAALAQISSFYEWNWPEAAREFQRAIELSPNYARAYKLYGEHLANLGRLKEALTAVRKAYDLDPLSALTLSNVGQILYFARQYDQAVEQLRQALDMDPNLVPAHLHLGMTYLQKRTLAAAIAEFETARTLTKGMAPAISLLGAAYALSGQRDKAYRMLADLEQRGGSPLLIATVFIGLGEKRRALDWLEKAYEARSPFMESLKIDPIFDSVRSDPRFKLLLQKMRLDN